LDVSVTTQYGLSESFTVRETSRRLMIDVTE